VFISLVNFCVSLLAAAAKSSPPEAKIIPLEEFIIIP